MTGTDFAAHGRINDTGVGMIMGEGEDFAVTARGRTLRDGSLVH
jgi:hypothetical protein